MWTLFKYENGGNPYIAMSEKETKRILRKYGKRAIKKATGFYYIMEEKQEILQDIPLF